MTNRRKQLLQLLQASHHFLESPEDEEKWLAFQKALETVEALEKAESVIAQPEVYRNPSPDTRHMLRRYYEAELRPRNRLFLWSSILVAVIIGVTVFGVTRGIFTPLTQSDLTTIPSITASVTSSQTPSPTHTLTASPTRTSTSTTVDALVPIVTPTSTDTPAPSETTTDTPSPTLTPTPTATLVSLFVTGEIAENLTNDIPSKQHIFWGQTGDIVAIQLNSQEFDPYLSILDPNGTEIASNDDCGSLRRACVGPIQLSADGIYIVVVDSFTRRATGSYTLGIEVTHLSLLSTTPNATPDCGMELPRLIIVTKESSIRLRSGPGQTFSVSGFVYNNECFAVIGRNASNSWLQIRMISGRTGWISSSLTQIQGSLDTVPITNS